MIFFSFSSLSTGAYIFPKEHIFWRDIGLHIFKSSLYIWHRHVIVESIMCVCGQLRATSVPEKFDTVQLLSTVRSIKIDWCRFYYSIRNSPVIRPTTVTFQSLWEFVRRWNSTDRSFGWNRLRATPRAAATFPLTEEMRVQIFASTDWTALLSTLLRYRDGDSLYTCQLLHLWEIIWNSG